MTATCPSSSPVEPNRPTGDRLLGGLLLAVLGLVAVVFDDYGITWDEPTQHQYGVHVLHYYTSLFQDTSCLSYLDAYLYGGLFNLVAAGLVRVSPLGLFETRHLLNAVVGVAGIAGTWKLAGELAGLRAAALAALLLLLDPSYFGHMFNNPKDIPFAAGYVWSLYYTLRATRHFPALPRSLVWKLGLAIGLTLGVRIGGLALLAYVALAAAAYRAAPARFETGEAPRPPRWPGSLAISLAATAAIAWAVMLLSWPWAQRQPLVRPFQALGEMSRFGIADSGLLAQVLIGGRYRHAKDLPATYLPHYLGVKLPELTLLGLALGAAMAVWYLVRPGRTLDRALVARYALVITATAAPVGYVILRRSVLYDTMRHFLFVVPCLYAFSGIALAEASRRLGGAGRRRRLLAHTVLALALVPQVRAAVALHPDQYVYYNRIAGGVQGAQGRYELDYWGNSYKEATERLVEYVASAPGGKDRKGPGRQRFRVYVRGPALSAAYYFPDSLQPAADPAAADFVITFTRWGFDRQVPGIPVVTVARQGAVLSVVKDVRDLHRASRRAEP